MVVLGIQKLAKYLMWNTISILQ